MKYNTWEKKKNLKNAKEVVAEFERRISTKVRLQEKLDKVEKKTLEEESY